MKIFVLGLDGATFDCLNPLMEEGVLPNIKEVCNKGASGPLRTIFPPVTGPAWLALATGLNPGKTGVFDYINKKSGEGIEMVPVSSAYYKNRAVWDLLGKKGYKVGVFNYPTLSPPPQVNGFAVSGMGGYKKEALCFPEELENELHKITNGYEVQLNLRSSRYKRNIQLFFDDLDRIISKQKLALQYLVKERAWDFFFAVFHFTDWMQHLLWKYLDDSHPLHDHKTAAPVKDRFKVVWGKVDEIIGELCDSLSDCNFMIVSDHGAGPLDSAFYPNLWLEKRGWLKKRQSGWKQLIAEKIKPLSAEIDNKYFSKAVRILKTRLLGIQGAKDLIDFDNSYAYCPEHAGMFGCINLTERGKRSKGFKEELMHELSLLPEKINGVKKIEVYLPEEIYSGPYINLSPDILFVVNEYRSSVEMDLVKEPFIQAPSIAMRTGSHRDNGVFMAKGYAFKNIQMQNTSILDIAPTILALFDIEIPFEIDGQVLTHYFNPTVLRSLNIRKSKEVSGGTQSVDERGDLEEMKRTLESLGYM